MMQEVNKEVAETYVNLNDVQTIVFESIPLIGKLSANAVEQSQDSKKASR